MNVKLRNRLFWAANLSLLIYAVSVVTLPVCLVKISTELNFNFTQAGFLGFISSFEQIFILILSGFIANRFGKIRILKIALLVLMSGLILFTFSNNYIFAVMLILFVGIGNGFLEAILTPLVEDLFPADNGSKMNHLHAFWPVGVLIGTLVVGELLSHGLSWRYIFMGVAVVVLAVFFFYPASKKVKLPASRSDFSHIKEILREPKFWILGFCLFFAGGAEGGFTYWTASYIQINFNALPRSGGVGTACFALGMAVGRFAASKLANKFGLKRMIVLSVLLSLVVCSVFFILNSLWVLYIFMGLIGLSLACFWPSLQSYAARVIPKDPTLIMIFLSCFGIPGFSSATLLMGIIGDHSGLKAGFIIAPIYLLVFLVLIIIERFVPVRQDNIVLAHSSGKVYPSR